MTSFRPAFWRRLPLLRHFFAWAHTPEFRRAVVCGDVDAARRALSRGACVHAMVVSLQGRPEPALVHAARTNDVEVLRLLISFGVNLEQVGSAPFDSPALATAVLARHWQAASQLVEAGARWDVPIRVLDATTLAAAVTLGGGLDPSRVQSVLTTLEELVEGNVQDLRGFTGPRPPLSEEPRARALLSLHRARTRCARLESRLPVASSSGLAKPRL